jgi:hypothetical protein
MRHVTLPSTSSSAVAPGSLQGAFHTTVSTISGAPAGVSAATPVPRSSRRGGVLSTAGLNCFAAAAVAAAVTAVFEPAAPGVALLLPPPTPASAASTELHCPPREHEENWAHQRSGAAHRGATSTSRRSGAAWLPAVSRAV